MTYVDFLAKGSRNLSEVLRHFALSALSQAQWQAACNTLHDLDRRTARSLLMMADRIGPNLPVTQEFLAGALGARRPTVNGVLVAFRKAGVIRHARGQIGIHAASPLERSGGRGLSQGGFCAASYTVGHFSRVLEFFESLTIFSLSTRRAS